MSDVIGRGVIEVSADSTKLRAGIDEAKRSIASLGVASSDVTKAQSTSIDNYIKRLGVQAVTIGESTRQSELLKLGLRGATDAQLASADAALKMVESHKQWVTVGEQVKTGLFAIAAAAVAVGAAGLVAFDSYIKKATDLKDASEKTGVSVENLSKIQFAAGLSGKNLDSVTSAMGILSKSMAGTGKEAAAASQALTFLGLSAKDDAGNTKDLNTMYGEIAVKLNEYSDGAGKNALARALMGKAGADQIPIMKELIELGAIDASLTTAQVDAAKAYRIEVALLNQKKEDRQS